VFRQKNKELGGYQVLEGSEKTANLSRREMIRSTRCTACAPCQFLLDNSSGVHSAGINSQVQESEFRTTKNVLLMGIEDLQIFRENRCLRIANAESPPEIT